MANNLKERIQKLRELAEKATPGPWQHSDPWRRKKGQKHIVDANGEMVSCHGFAATRKEVDGDFIAAANPATVLALIAEIERLERENDIPDGSVRLTMDRRSAGVAVQALKDYEASLYTADPAGRMRKFYAEEIRRAVEESYPHLIKESNEP